jgi:hypothetical protein
MNGTETITQEYEIILRRLLDEPPLLATLVPIGLAFFILFTVLLAASRDSVGAMLKRAHIPGLLAGLVWLVWGVGLLAYAGTMVGLVLAGIAPPAELVLLGAIPLAAVPLLFGLFIAVMVCVRNPAALLAVAGLAVICAAYFAAYFIFWYRLHLPGAWFALLVPVLALALVYVVLMYVRDARTVHPAWAAFLGLLRCAVYVILAGVFFLPASQTYHTTETHSKVLVIFDVSGSMLHTIDDVPAPNQDPKTLPTRQDKVVKLLSEPDRDGRTFFDRVQLKSPATAYRFGMVLDEVEVQQFLDGRRWGKGEWHAWLFPDRNKIEVPREVRGRKLTEAERRKLRLKLANLYEDLVGGTNVSGSSLQAVVREAGSRLQAVVIISDGRSNLGSGETFRELRARAADPKRPFHIITVGVGEHRQPVAVRVEDLAAPQQASPDEPFPVGVTVIGDGLADQTLPVTLEAQRVEKQGGDWKPVAGDRFTLPGEVRFDKTGGEHPYGEVKFTIDMAKERAAKEGDKGGGGQAAGTWEFRAYVPRHRLEAYPKAKHVNKRPARVVVQKRPLRVLLFAGGPTREYQFLRTMFYREVQEKRMELSIFLQSAADKDVDQEVESGRLLTDFPAHLASDPRLTTPGLSDFDVVIAFDPDWSRLDAEQLKTLKEWVHGPSRGGFVFVAGPINTYQIARKQHSDEELRKKKEEQWPVLHIMPVVLNDSRLHDLGIDFDARRPYVLHFPGGVAKYEFLQLEEGQPERPMEGWDKFFWGEDAAPEAGKDFPPRRGFYNYYPAEKVRPGAELLATFAGPPASRINAGRDEQPFLVSMKAGGGLAVYLSAGEMWRLREYKHAYHERFWVKLVRYAASANQSQLSRYGLITMPERVRTGLVKVEAQVLGSDRLPLPRDARPTVKLIRPKEFDPKADRETPKEFDLKAKPGTGEFQGWFTVSVRINTPGDYTLRIPIPGTTQALEHDLSVYRPDPETEITRPDLGYLYQLATSARPVLSRFRGEQRKKLEEVLRPPPASKDDRPENAAPAAPSESDVRLYFPLAQAGRIPDLLVTVPPAKESQKGRLQDLWDQGTDFAGTVALYGVLLFVWGLLAAFNLVLLLVLAGRWPPGRLLLAALASVVVQAALAVAGWLLFLALPDLADVEWPLPGPFALRADLYTMLAVGVIGAAAAAILLLTQRWVAAIVCLALTAVVVLGVLAVTAVFEPPWAVLPLSLSSVLGLVVGLLALEWLVRKLLKLA